MSTHNIGFYEEIAKLTLNYHQISSNMHLIFSAGFIQFKVCAYWVEIPSGICKTFFFFFFYSD